MTDDSSVSFADIFRFHGIQKWKMEREASALLVELWRSILSSSFHEDDKVILTNVVWAHASLERAFQFMHSNTTRIEHWYRDGVPEIMHSFTGPYGPRSLDYLAVTSLWMDLADVFMWYRTVEQRIGYIKRSIRRKGFRSVDVGWVDEQIKIVQNRRIKEFGNQKMYLLANNVLHESWHPAKTEDGLSLGIYWREVGGRKFVSFTEEGDVVESVLQVVNASRKQIRSMVQKCIELDS